MAKQVKIESVEEDPFSPLDEDTPEPKKQNPLFSFGVDPRSIKNNPNWRTKVISQFDITVHSVGDAAHFLGRCTMEEANKVHRSGLCGVSRAGEDELNP